MDIETARGLFPALQRVAYFNTAAVAPGNTRLRNAYSTFIDQWTDEGFDFVRAERSAEAARRSVAKLIGANDRDIALIPSVSSAAGLIASQFLKAERGENLIIGKQEYSSNHFPWRQLEARGYDVRQVPFRNGGIDPDAVRDLVDGGTQLVAFSAIQTATGHRTDIRSVAEIARRAGAWVFVDGSQSVGAVPMADQLECIDFLATSDHKFLLNAARGMGYMYVRRQVQAGILPVNAGWKAGVVPFDSFFGPTMLLSETASRFDNSISWLAAIGDEVCLGLIEEIGADAIYHRNRELASALREALARRGVKPLEMPEGNRSHIVSVPLAGHEPSSVLATLKARGVVCSARDGNLRIALHFFNTADDIEKLVTALPR